MNTTQNYSSVSLRKLTWKSVWDFTPKYMGMTIERVFEIKPSSVWWLYCRYEKISFVDEVLEVLESKFPLERIQKPGIDPTQIDNYFNGNTYKEKSLFEIEKMIQAKRINGQVVPKSLIEELNQKRVDRKRTDFDVVISKRSLQSVNHGKLRI
jgi:hypothetical protein